MRKVTNLFSPIEFSDVEMQHRASLLMRVTFLSLLGSLIFGITGLVLHWGGAISTVSIVYAILALGCLWLIRHGNLELPGILIPLTLLILITYQIIINHGAHDQGILIYPVVIAFAWLLLNRRMAMLILLLGLGSAFLVIYLEVNGSIIPHVDGSSEYADIITFAVTLGSIAFLTDSVVENLRGAIKRLQISENDLRLREAEIRAYIEESPIGICIMDEKWRIELVNSQLLEILGFAREEVQGHDGAEFISQIEQKRLPLLHIDDLKEGKPIREERALTRKDGSMIWVLGSARRLRDGRIQYSIQDITERKHAEKALQISEDMYRRAITTAGAVPYYRDHILGKYTFIGEGILQMTGYSAEEMTPEIWDSLEQEGFPRGKLAHLTYEEADHLTEEDGSIVWECDYRIRTRDGQVRWVADTSVKGLNDDGERVGVIGILQDITDTKNALIEREKLIKDLERRNAELERFTYTVSHDLKSPLVTIQGYLGYIENDVFEGNHERIQKDIQRIKDATVRMQSLLKDLLELSRIGRMMNPFEDVPLADIIHEALNNVAGQIQENKIHIEIEGNLPIIHGDRARLVEVLQNLIDNACKYMGEQPTPRIKIGQRSKINHTVFYVQDNGIGIEPTYHENIFGLFNKLDPRSEGTGIGLSLVKRIIEEVHGGKIWVESEGKGKGSTFCFTILEKK